MPDNRLYTFEGKGMIAFDNYSDQPSRCIWVFRTKFEFSFFFSHPYLFLIAKKKKKKKEKN